MSFLSDLPGHTLPNYSEDISEDALFHYTDANGLIGILQSKGIWSTAYYCTNDASELRAGRDVLTPVFRKKTHEMERQEDSRVVTIRNRGVDIRQYAEKFEQRIINHSLHFVGVYVTCFCKPNNKEDFLHGLLSQWRAYGNDGGYALQFSRGRLQDYLVRLNEDLGLNYEVQDVYYSPDNPLKKDVVSHSESFISSYVNFLDDIVNLNASDPKFRSPVQDLFEGPLESLLDYLIHTKNQHFFEESECRMSIVDAINEGGALLPMFYFNRNGLVVPYVRTPKNYSIIDCVDWIVIGPGPRIGDRFNSVKQMVNRMGLDIEVRPSHIPLSRD